MGSHPPTGISPIAISIAGGARCQRARLRRREGAVQNGRAAWQLGIKRATYAPRNWPPPAPRQPGSLRVARAASASFLWPAAQAAGTSGYRILTSHDLWRLSTMKLLKASQDCFVSAKLELPTTLRIWCERARHMSRNLIAFIQDFQERHHVQAHATNTLLSIGYLDPCQGLPDLEKLRGK